MTVRSGAPVVQGVHANVGVGSRLPEEAYHEFRLLIQMLSKPPVSGLCFIVYARSHLGLFRLVLAPTLLWQLIGLQPICLSSQRPSWSF